MTVRALNNPRWFWRIPDDFESFSMVPPTDWSNLIQWNRRKRSDVAIGSYMSSQVVILRSQPIIRFDMNLTSSVARINPNGGSVLITACVTITSPTPLPPLLCKEKQIASYLTQMAINFELRDSGRYLRDSWRIFPLLRWFTGAGYKLETDVTYEPYPRLRLVEDGGAGVSRSSVDYNQLHTAKQPTQCRSFNLSVLVLIHCYCLVGSSTTKSSCLLSIARRRLRRWI